ncbi:MAG: EFR1 family ferrodoxin [Methanospirillum sp.]
MSIALYYFSGSGNSLHAARELRQRLPGADLMPMCAVPVRARSRLAESRRGSSLIHGMTLPIPVGRFVARLDPGSARCMFAVVTRVATPHRAFAEIDRMPRKRGRRLDALFTLTMAGNDPKFRDRRPPAQDELTRLEPELGARLDAIREIVVGRQKSRGPDTDAPVPVALLERLVLLGMAFAESDGAGDYYFANDRCTGCGTCERVCLSGNVRMAGKRPV